MTYRQCWLTIGSIFLVASIVGVTAHSQQADERVKLDLTRAEVQIIVNGLLELPYKTAAPVLIELKRQVDEQAPKPQVPPTPPKAPK